MILIENIEWEDVGFMGQDLPVQIIADEDYEIFDLSESGVSDWLSSKFDHPVKSISFRRLSEDEINRIGIFEENYNSYNFGCQVEGVCAYYNLRSTTEWTQVFYVEDDDGGFLKGEFTVVFSESDECRVLERYALLNGERIGSPDIAQISPSGLSG